MKLKALTLGLLLVVPSISFGIQYRFEQISAPFGNYSEVSGINQSGQIVGTALNSTGSIWRPFTRNAAAGSAYDVVPSPTTGSTVLEAVGISSNGTIVGRVYGPARNNEGNQSFYYHPTTGLVINPYFSTGSPSNEFVYRVNENGDMSGRYGTNGAGWLGVYHRLANGTIRDFGVINDTIDIPDESGYMISEGNYVYRPDLSRFRLQVLNSGDYTRPLKVYSDGTIVGTYTYSGIPGSYFSLFDINGNIISIGSDRMAVDTVVCAKSSKTVAFNGYRLDNQTLPAKLFTYTFGGVMTDMSQHMPTAYEVIDVKGINDRGQIVGLYTQSRGSNILKSFLLDPVPEPGTLVAIAVGLAGLAKRRRKVGA